MPTEIVNSRLVDALKPFFVTWSAYQGGTGSPGGVTSIIGNDGITASAPTGDVTLDVDLASPSGLSFLVGELQIDDSIAGAGLAIASKVLAVGAGAGITVNQNDVALTLPGTLSVSSANVATGNHTHAITTGNAITTATAVIMATNASGYHQLLRLGAGIAPTVPLHALSATNATALQVEAPSLVGSPAVSIQNMPLSSNLDTGKALEFKVTSESFGRVMLYSDGKIGVGPGTATRDTILSRAAANTWLISSDGATGVGHLQFNSTGWIGLGSAAGRITFDNQATDIIRINAADLHFHNGTADILEIRFGGDVAATQADIYAAAGLGLAADDNVGIFIDANNSGTDGYFAIYKNAENVAGATEVMRMTEGGVLFIGTTTNTFSTKGLTIKGTGNDTDEMICLKHSSALIGMTDFAETDTALKVTIAHETEAGVRFFAFTEGNLALHLRGAVTSGNSPTNGAASIGPIMLQGEIKSGTGTASLGANLNVVVTRNRGNAIHMIDSEGDTHRDGTDNTFSAWNDAHLARAFELAMSPDSVDSEFDRWLEYGRDDLIRAGILHECGFYNESKLLRLVVGGTWQGYTHRQQLEQRIAKLEETINEQKTRS